MVTCIRTGTTIDYVGFERERHADRYLKPPEEMERLFPRYPEALARTMKIVARCRFSLEELIYQYPEEAIVSGKTAQESLEHYVCEFIPHRDPEGLPRKVLKVVRHERELIRSQNGLHSCRLAARLVPTGEAATSHDSDDACGHSRDICRQWRYCDLTARRPAAFLRWETH